MNTGDTTKGLIRQLLTEIPGGQRDAKRVRSDAPSHTQYSAGG
jgi:hypothetical protein